MRFNKDYIDMEMDDVQIFGNYDDNVELDFIEDSPKSHSKQTAEDKWKIIDDRLSRIENYLKQLINRKPEAEEIFGKDTVMEAMDRIPESARKVLDTPFAAPPIPNMNNYFTANVNQANLHAPRNVMPQGSMLEEIQSVLTAQDVMQDPTNANPVDITCSSNMIYDYL